MAAAATPVLESAIMALLRAIGFSGSAAVVSGGANELARERVRSADRAKDSPLAQAGTQSKSKEREKCQKCPPDKGTIFRRVFRERKPWVDYQSRIAKLPSGPNFIDEWDFEGIRFDGFFSSQCLLVDAKGGYDQFFNNWKEPLDWWSHNVEILTDEIVRQNYVALPKPPVRLEWFWQQPVSYRYFSTILAPAAPDVLHHFEP